MGNKLLWRLMQLPEIVAFLLYWINGGTRLKSVNRFERTLAAAWEVILCYVFVL
jgi:hypothetical protein